MRKGLFQCWQTWRRDNWNLPRYLIVHKQQVRRSTSNKDILTNPKSFYFKLLKKMLRVSQDELWNTLK